MVALAIESFKGRRACHIKLGKEVRRAIDVLDCRGLRESEICNSIIVYSQFGKRGSAFNLELGNLVARGVEFGKRCCACYRHSGDCVAAHVDRSQSGEAAQVKGAVSSCLGVTFFISSSIA